MQSQTYAVLVDFIMRLPTNGSGEFTVRYQKIFIKDSRTRFITPIFLHAGIVHLLLNMLAQVFVAAQVCSNTRLMILLI